MISIDDLIVSFLNQFARRSYTFDMFVELLAHNDVVKTGVFVALVYWSWFREDAKTADRRATLAFGVMASWAAVIVARVLAVVLPFRERPLRVPALHFVTPYSINPRAVLGWSAFPSDNAALFFGLAACLFLVSRRAGLMAFGHAMVVVAFARVYLGLHYPTDIAGGALIGIGAVCLGLVPAVRADFVGMSTRGLRDHPRAFHTAFCLVVVCISSTFQPLLVALRFVSSASTLAIQDMVEHGQVLEVSVVLAGLVLLVTAGVLVRCLRLRRRHRA